MGVFFNTSSGLNHSFRVQGERTRLAGELCAVEYALNNRSINKDAVIVTYNKTVISYINEFEIMESKRKYKKQ